MPVYRYKHTLVNSTDLGKRVPGALTPGNTGPDIYKDITAPSGSKLDLDDYMATLGFTYDSTDPVTTPIQATVSTLSSPITATLTEGNVLQVDAVNGNDSTGTRGIFSKPFLTIAAAIAAASSGDEIHVRPGTYTLAAGITLPTGVSMRGADATNTILQFAASGTTTLITMGESSRLEDFLLSLTATTHVNLTGILFPGTTAATAKIRSCALTVDNSTAGAGTSTIYGVLVQSTGTPDRNTSAIRTSTILIKSTGSGNKRGIIQNTSVGNFNCRDINIRVQNVGGGAGDFTGVETAIASGLVTCVSGSIQGDSTDYLQTTGRLELSGTVLVTAATDASDIIPFPETRVTGNSTRICQTSLEGGSYTLSKRTAFSRIAFRLTALSLGGTIKMLIYQAPGGAGGIAKLIGSITAFAPSASGNQSVQLAEGDVFLEPGVFYVLFGRDSGLFTMTMRTYTVQTLDLINSNMDTSLHATNFTTAIAASSTPATFDPRESPTGSSTSSTLDLAPVIRLKR